MQVVHTPGKPAVPAVEEVFTLHLSRAEMAVVSAMAGNTSAVMACATTVASLRHASLPIELVESLMDVLGEIIPRGDYE